MRDGGGARTAWAWPRRDCNRRGGDQSLLGKTDPLFQVIISRRAGLSPLRPLRRPYSSGVPPRLTYVGGSAGGAPAPCCRDWPLSAVSSRLPVAGWLMDGAASQSAWASLLGCGSLGTVVPEAASPPGGPGRGAAPGSPAGCCLGRGFLNKLEGGAEGRPRLRRLPLRCPRVLREPGPEKAVPVQAGPRETPINKHLSEPSLWQWLGSGGRSPNRGQRGVKMTCGGQGARDRVVVRDRVRGRCVLSCSRVSFPELLQPSSHNEDGWWQTCWKGGKHRAPNTSELLNQPTTKCLPVCRLLAVFLLSH